jgi:hypothetical protein
MKPHISRTGIYYELNFDLGAKTVRPRKLSSAFHPTFFASHHRAVELCDGQCGGFIIRDPHVSSEDSRRPIVFVLVAPTEVREYLGVGCYPARIDS